MATPDISKLRRTMVYSWELFYEQQPDGTRILRHIRVNNTRYEVPADGISVEIPDDSVGTEHIKDSSIQMQDLSDDVKSQMGETTTYDEGDEQLVFNK